MNKIYHPNYWRAEIDADFVHAYHNRGEVYTELGDQQEAIRDFKKAAKFYAEQGDTANQQEVLELLKQLQQG
ncbi:MAG: tetratricopeptide repeat protein [Symploca sp. SIO2D2]|nr:tetratricopeptide repeat protein [Symploca sp. SIO2D2]